MSRIRSQDTAIEVDIRKALFSRGFRYRKNVKNLPGAPDIVLPKYHTVVFVNGCFWHGHKNCKAGRIPKSRIEYWVDKIENNILRDKKNEELLRILGWKVIIVWECEVTKDFDETLIRMVQFITSSSD